MTGEIGPLPHSDTLVEAIERGDLRLVEKLIDSGVNINQSPSGSDTISPLGYAVAYKQLEIVQTLLAAGAEPHGYILIQIEPTPNRQTLDILSLLVAAGIDVSFSLEEGNSLLMKAAGQGELDLVKLLVEGGANVNQKNQYGESAIFCAAQGGWQEVYSYLVPLTAPEIRAEADRQIQEGLLRRKRIDDKFTDAFITAASLGKTEIVINSIKAQVNIDAFSAEGTTALFNAATGGHLDAARALLEAGVDVNLGRESDRATPLIEAIGRLTYAKYFDREREQLGMIQLLVEAGADVNAVTSEGWNALTAAVNSESRAAVELLLHAGADVNTENPEGMTPLMTAAASGNLEIVIALVEAGADINARDALGESAVDYARESRKSSEIIQILQAADIISDSLT